MAQRREQQTNTENQVYFIYFIILSSLSLIVCIHERGFHCLSRSYAKEHVMIYVPRINSLQCSTGAQAKLVDLGSETKDVFLFVKSLWQKI